MRNSDKTFHRVCLSILSGSLLTLALHVYVALNALWQSRSEGLNATWQEAFGMWFFEWESYILLPLVLLFGWVRRWPWLGAWMLTLHSGAFWYVVATGSLLVREVHRMAAHNYAYLAFSSSGYFLVFFGSIALFRHQWPNLKNWVKNSPHQKEKVVFKWLWVGLQFVVLLYLSIDVFYDIQYHYGWVAKVINGERHYLNELDNYFPLYLSAFFFLWASKHSLKALVLLLPGLPLLAMQAHDLIKYQETYQRMGIDEIILKGLPVLVLGIVVLFLLTSILALPWAKMQDREE